MRIVIFCHSLISDWNHGNAHFLRGVAGEMIARGHDVRVYEPRDAWSLGNLLHDAGDGVIDAFHQAYPSLSSTRYDPASIDLDEALDAADLVLVHEWNDRPIVERIGRHRVRSSRPYALLFHDTHHRSVTDPAAMAAYDLQHYDGVLAFGDVIRERYIAQGWADRAWTWHEAADTRVFRPLAPTSDDRGDVIWIGNWGDEERSQEIRDYLIAPVRQLGLAARVHGVRYPADALRELQAAGIRFGGWIANYAVPAAFAAHTATVHIPRRPYVTALPGIPTIRMFEALACGIPLVSAWWDDAEGLFRPGADYLVARTPQQMTAALRDLLADAGQRRALAANGLDTIRNRHTCVHRVSELLQIAGVLAGSPLEKALSL